MQKTCSHKKMGMYDLRMLEEKERATRGMEGPQKLYEWLARRVSVYSESKNSIS